MARIYKSTLLYFLLGLAVWGALVWHGAGFSPRPAYACSGATENLTLEYYIEQADAIAIVGVTEVGGAANETPPFPPGTRPDHPGVGGGSGIREDFHFYGYRAQAEVIEVIEGSLPVAIEIDRALRAQMERVVRQYELGNRLVPCFFGMQQRYQPDTDYLAFLEKTDEGWNTVRQYELSGGPFGPRPTGRPPITTTPTPHSRRGDLQCCLQRFRRFRDSAEHGRVRSALGNPGTTSTLGHGEKGNRAAHGIVGYATHCR